MLINYINFSNKKLAKYEVLLNLVFENVIKELKLISNLEVNLSLVSKKQIKNLNKTTRNINKVTDVLSYPTLDLSPEQNYLLSELVTVNNFKNDIMPDTNNLFLGDIAVCYKVVKKQAKEYQNTIERELAYMTVHGILHLLGFDHYEKEDKTRMRIVEEGVLAKLNLSRDN